MPPKKTLGEPDAGNPQVRFDEGALETEPWPKRGTGMLRKQPGTATPRSYSHRASALLHVRAETHNYQGGAKFFHEQQLEAC